jgi:hypothetical protein
MTDHTSITSITLFTISMGIITYGIYAVNINNTILHQKLDTKLDTKLDKIISILEEQNQRKREKYERKRMYKEEEEEVKEEVQRIKRIKKKNKDILNEELASNISDISIEVQDSVYRYLIEENTDINNLVKKEEDIGLDINKLDEKEEDIGLDINNLVKKEEDIGLDINKLDEKEEYTEIFHEGYDTFPCNNSHKITGFKGLFNW